MEEERVGWIVSTLNSHVEILTPSILESDYKFFIFLLRNVTIFEDSVFQEVIKLKWGH